MNLPTVKINPSSAWMNGRIYAAIALSLIAGTGACGTREVPAQFTGQTLVCLAANNDTLFVTDRINAVRVPDGGGFFGYSGNRWQVWYDATTEELPVLGRFRFPGHRYPTSRYVEITGTCILK